jgi:hypothetical protein
MKNLEVIIRVYNLSLDLLVTPTDNQFYRFKVEIVNGGDIPMVFKYQPDHSWILEKATMKFFTKKYVAQLGALVQIKRPEWFNQHAYE